MKKKSVNRKVMSSIGVSLLATVTTCTNVYAAAPALVEDGNSAEAQVFSIENEPVTSSAATQGSSEMQGELNETPVLSGAEGSVKEELDKAQEAVGDTGEAEPLKEAVNDIGGALEEAQEAVDHVKTDIENLDNLNQKADVAVENYTEKVEDSEDLIETWADNVEKANESAEAANDQASEAKDNADQILKDVTAAQSNSNRSEEEAAAAKSQAQEEAQKAQEEYEKAQEAQAAAQEEVKKAKDSLTAVEETYSEAQQAYNDADAAVKKAQEALEAIKGNGEIEIDGVTYKGNSKEAQEAAQKAKAKAEEAFKEAEKNLESATIEYNNAEELLKLTTAKMEIISSIQNETNKEEAYKKLEENLEAIDNEEITEANEAYKTATGQLENLDIAIAKKEAADLKVDECTDENVEKLVEQEKGIIDAFDAYQNVPDDKWSEKNSAKDQYYKAADKLAEAIVIYQLESAGMSVGNKPLDGYWVKSPDDGKNYMRMTYQENGATRVAYFNYVTKPDGTIDVLYRPSTYNSIIGGNSLQVEIVDNKTVFKLNGEEIAADRVEYDGISYKVDGKLYSRELKFEGTGNPYYPAQKLVDYKVEQSKAIEAQKEADEKLRQEIGNSKNSGLVDSTLNEELTKDNIAAIRAEASTSTQNKGNDLANAVGKYAEDLVNRKNSEEAQKNAANDKKNNIINRNEQLTNVIGACSHVIDIVEKIKDLQAQADVSRDQLDQLKAKRDEVKGNYDNASDKATVAAELVAQAGEAAAEAMRIAGLDFLFTSAPTTPTIPTTPTTPDGGGTGTTDPDNGGGTGTTDPGYGGDGTGTDVGGTGTTDVAAAEDTGATTPGGADMMADGPDATALVATAAVLPDGAEPIALAAGGNMNAGAAAGDDAGEATDDEADGLRVVEEEEVPLANADLESIDEDEEEESAEVRQIEDEETPLADLDLETEKSRMSWWWLLIIAVCGATGYEMYKKHKKKMEAENAMK